MSLPRRQLLKAGGAAAVAVPLAWLFRGEVSAQSRILVPDPKGLLDLPPGFSYRVIQRVFDPMTDGYRVPARPDGMACFPASDGTWILMRNHELDYAQPLGAYDLPAPRAAYDSKAFGGVTRVVVDPRTLEAVTSNLVLTGTLRNCAGGPSPWGWLSCEEAVDPGHGFVFLCSTASAELAAPQKISSYGRFNHEAVCIDPKTNIAYLTEDRLDGCLYRFSPARLETPFVGQLQAARIVGRPGFDTSAMATPGETLPVEWVDVPDPTPLSDTVRYQSYELGAALICRGEGIAFHQGKVFVCSTSGGPIGCGQIFELSRAPDRSESLRLVAAAADDRLFDHPDNITLTPWGHVLMAEDGSGDQFVRGLTPSGRVYSIARNAHSGGELTGLCLSPDGSTLFLNLQHEGITFAITGPLASLGV